MGVSENFSVKVVGSFDIFDSNGISIRPTARKDCALIAMLVLTQTHRQTRSWLQEKLWGESSPRQAAASLRQSLTNLRGLLNRNVEVICADRTWVWLDSQHITQTTTTSFDRNNILRGLDLKEEGFNEWLRETRLETQPLASDSLLENDTDPIYRSWHFTPAEKVSCDRAAAACENISDCLVESLLAIGLPVTTRKHILTSNQPPHAIDMVVTVRAFSIGSDGVLSVVVTDGFGTVHWQIRREVELSNWNQVRTIQNELTQLFQDFAVRLEAEDRKQFESWGPYTNGCRALMGILVPGSVPLLEIIRCCEAAIAVKNNGIYYALLGFAHLLLYGERQSQSIIDPDEAMGNFRTALNLSPTNGLVLALAGHAYGFLLKDLERNEAMTRESVRLLPGSCVCWTFRAVSLIYNGLYTEAISAAQRSVHLSNGTVAQPKAHSTELFARLMSGDTDGAIRAGENCLQAIEFRPTTMDLMTAYAYENRPEEGRAKLDILKIREPEFSIDLLKSPEYPIVNAHHRDITVKAAQKLGLS